MSLPPYVSPLPHRGERRGEGGDFRSNDICASAFVLEADFEQGPGLADRGLWTRNRQEKGRRLVCASKGLLQGLVRSLEAADKHTGRRSMLDGLGCDGMEERRPLQPVVGRILFSQAGSIFWFMRKRLSGSYLRFAWARRS